MYRTGYLEMKTQLQTIVYNIADQGYIMTFYRTNLVWNVIYP